MSVHETATGSAATDPRRESTAQSKAESKARSKEDVMTTPDYVAGALIVGIMVLFVVAVASVA